LGVGFVNSSGEFLVHFARLSVNLTHEHMQIYKTMQPSAVYENRRGETVETFEIYEISVI